MADENKQAILDELRRRAGSDPAKLAIVDELQRRSPMTKVATAEPEAPKADALSMAGSFLKGAVVNTAKGAWEGAKQAFGAPELIGQEQAAGDYAMRALTGGANVGPMVRGMARGSFEEGKKAWEAARQGRYSEAAGYGVAALLPGIGPAAAGIGERAGDAAAEGDYNKVAEELGNTAAMVGPSIPVVRRGVAKISDAANNIKITNPNAAEVAAHDYLVSRGVPANGAAATGSPMVRMTQKMADSTPIGAIIAEKAAAKGTRAIQAESKALVNRATPPGKAMDHYAEFEKAAADPANVMPVTMGYKPGPGGTQIPIVENIAIPVRLDGLKAKFKSALDDMELILAPSAINDTSARAALRQLMDAPGAVPARQAELALSGLKGMARTADGRAAGIAKQLVAELQPRIDRAVAGAGPDVVRELRNGRAAAKAEVGAKWLEDQFAKAESAGGFNREQGLWASWDQFKRSGNAAEVFAPMMADDLNKFFLGVKKFAENPNPSGSGVAGSIALQGSGMLVSPGTVAATWLSAGTISKMLHSPRGVRALTHGLEVANAGTKAQQALAAQRIVRIAGELGEKKEGK